MMNFKACSPRPPLSITDGLTCSIPIVRRLALRLGRNWRHVFIRTSLYLGGATRVYHRLLALPFALALALAFLCFIFLFFFQFLFILRSRWFDGIVPNYTR